MGAHFEALDEGVRVAPLDSRYTQVGINLNSVQVYGTWEKVHARKLQIGDFHLRNYIPCIEIVSGGLFLKMQLSANTMVLTKLTLHLP